ncbi:tautomerase family protein [Aquabacter sp. P-9]|uniref:tautomerase family protein n=1 Tax=Aquabacter sediminis TaxID=3029197 RepID=UPI00237D46AB|nr:tautomerase family protein [Aquabacter sp. P-9]MDE1570843.1 tautomerase family protein [Aquabacter sp. P-9]
MPILQVTLSSSPDSSQARAIAAMLSGLSARILRKDEKLTSVAVTFLSADQWFVAGESLAEAGLASFWLDIAVVDGTNTKDEKAAFIAATFAAMAQALGPLHPESYVLVREVKADAYGYGGRTQESRYVEKTLKAAA